MTRAEGQKLGGVGGNSRTRGPYATQACDVCRRKKIKCSEERPVCGSCKQSKRHNECTWTGEPVRPPRTEAHFESLRKRVEALQDYADLLESMLDKCRKEHGGVSSDDTASYLQLRPQGPLQDDFIDGDEDPSASETDIGQELSVATQSLKLEERDLIFYGTAAPFRFAEPPINQTSRFPNIIADPHGTYVLLVNDAEQQNYSEIDWSRYLPPDSQLDRLEHDKILDRLFKFFTSWCLRIVPALFLRDMYRALTADPQTPPKTPHYSPMLHNALIALATAFSDDPDLRDIRVRQDYANAAKKYIEEECRQPNICVVEALSLLGSFHSSKGDQNLGYLYFGMSTRIGQILGLSVDCSNWVQDGLISHDDMLDRNWAHWTIFSLDVCWSLYVGRECTVPIPVEGQHIPVPFVDRDFDQVPWHYPQANIPPQPNYLSRTFAATCELLVISRRVMEVVNGMSNPGTTTHVSDEVISKLDLQLNTWKGNLTPEVDITLANRNTATPHRLMMHLLYWLSFILLHRPFFHRRTKHIYSSDKDIDHVKLCKRSAENIMDILGTWQRLYGLRFTPVTLFQAVFSTGTVYLLLAVQAASGPRVAKAALMSSLSQVELCIQYLREVGKSWQSANNIAEILRKLLQDQLRPLLDKNSVTGLDLSQKSNTRPQHTQGRPATTDDLPRERPPVSPHFPLSAPPTNGQPHHQLFAPDPQEFFQQYTQQQFQQPQQSPNDPWSTLSNASGSPTFQGQIPVDATSVFAEVQRGYMPGLGGEILSDMPFIPPFTNVSFDHNYLQQQLGMYDPMQLLDIPETELATLHHYMN